jgi:S-adenosylmethionine:diacylglycerol 3-amino-3-carboxypropyl transferase
VQLRRTPITFSITTEDHEVLEEALALTGGESVVCIASSGDTPLNLLRCAPERIDAVDMNVDQLALAMLKAQGLEQLELDEFRVLLGVVRDPKGALEAYNRIRASLPRDARRFWDDHRAMIRGGVLWRGGLMRFFHLARLPFTWLLPKTAWDELARVSTPEQGSAFYQGYVATYRFRLFLALIANCVTYAAFYPSRGWSTLPPGMSPTDFSLLKIREALAEGRIADNPYLFPFIFGRYASVECVPPYLSSASYERIRARGDRVRFVHSDLMTYLRGARTASVDAFALSNVVDWMDDPTIAELFAQLARVGKHGARIVMFSRGISLASASLPNGLKYQRELAEKLLRKDRTRYHRSVNVFFLHR